MWKLISKDMLLLCAIIYMAIDACSSVSVSNISLSGGRQLAQLHSTASLQCNHELEEAETIQKLGWFRNGVPVLTWTPPDAAVASVEYRGRLDVSANDGSLVFSKVTVDDAGAYSCTVQSSTDKQDSSDPYNLAVADVPAAGFTMHGNVADCVLYFSFSSPPIYPKPTPLCGVWATDTNYTSTATDWQAVPYYNGSVAYSIVDTTFSVRGMPLQAGIKCEMSFPPPAGAHDSNKIIAWTNTAYYPQVSERGCPALDVGDDIQVHYKNHRITCRGELTQQDAAFQLVAMISCKPGKKSSLRGGGMSALQLTCSTGQWEPVGGISWTEFEDMECSDDAHGGAGEAATEEVQKLENLEEEEPVGEPENAAPAITAAATVLASAAMLLLVQSSFF